MERARSARASEVMVCLTHPQSGRAKGEEPEMTRRQSHDANGRVDPMTKNKDGWSEQEDQTETELPFSK